MPEIGQRVRLSKGDIAQTMALYGCPGKTRGLYVVSHVMRKGQINGLKFTNKRSH